MGVLKVSPKDMDKCIEECLKCLRACEECFTACLAEADVQSRVNCIKILNDCAEICAQAVQFMSRNSSYAKALCKLCADICDACAQECGMHNDSHCPQCAQICRQCAQECRTMANS